MSLEVTVWSDVGVAVQTVLASPKTISAITKANPAVASSTAHGFNDGDLVLLKVSGMADVDYLVARVDNKTTDAFDLEGVDSTDFDTFVSGTAEKITFGAAASTITNVTASGGEAEDINIRTIHRSQDFVIPGNFAPLVMNMESLWDVNDPALLALKAFSKAKTPAAIAITFATGSKVYFAATPGVSLAPTGSAGGPVTTPVKLGLRGDLTAYAS